MKHARDSMKVAREFQKPVIYQFSFISKEKKNKNTRAAKARHEISIYLTLIFIHIIFNQSSWTVDRIRPKENSNKETNKFEIENEKCTLCGS